MQKIDRSRLLNFLSKPRYAREVAQHFNVSAKLANYHLKEAVKCGQVLVSEKHVSQSFLRSRNKLKQLDGFLYASRNSSLPSEHLLEFVANKDKTSALRSKSDVASVKFLLHSESPVGKDASRKVAVPKVFETLVARGKLVRKRLLGQLSPREVLSKHDEPKSLTHAEEIRLFEALLKQPLPFLDIHSRFGVSKRTVKGFVNRGLVEEEWGARDIGVRFKLTKSGRDHLKMLHAAARFEPGHRKNIFLHLKHLIS